MEKKIVTLTREQFEIYRTCKVNPFYLANFVYIIHPVKGKVKFNLYEYQRAVLWNFLNNRFNIILKFRQAGLTELIAFFCLWLAMFNDNKNIQIISIKDMVAKRVLKRIKYMYKNLPEWLQTPVTQIRGDSFGTATVLEFVNGSSITSVPTTEEAGRSEAVSLLVIDEAAIVRWADRIWAAAFPTLSCAIYSTPILYQKKISLGKINGKEKFRLYTKVIELGSICPKERGVKEISSEEVYTLTHEGNWRKITHTQNKGNLETWYVEDTHGNIGGYTPAHRLFTTSGWKTVREIIEEDLNIVGVDTKIKDFRDVNTITKPPLVEEIKPIKDFPDFYISNLGNVYRKKKGNLTKVAQRKNKFGYFRVGLSYGIKRETGDCKNQGKSKLFQRNVHVLVAEAFLGQKPNGYQVDHIDNDKSHNYITNLRYVTPKENIEKAYKENLGLYLNPISGDRLPDLVKRGKILEMRKQGYSYKEIANEVYPDNLQASKFVKRIFEERGGRVYISKLTLVKKTIEPIYDIQVEGDHSYISADGFVNHNTGGSAILNSCVTGDTEIVTKNGPLRIDTVCPKEMGIQDISYLGIEVLSHTGNWRKVTHSVNKGVLKTWEVEDEYGNKLRCTPAHKLYTTQGWRSVGRIVREGLNMITFDTGFKKLENEKTEKPSIEVFKNIPGYPKYMLSNWGKLYIKDGDSLIEKEPMLGNSGYYRVKLWEKGESKNFSLSRLVAKLFIGDIPEGYVVDHIDCNHAHNYVTNLQIISQSENTKRVVNLSPTFKVAPSVGDKFPDILLIGKIKEKYQKYGNSYGSSKIIIKEIEDELGLRVNKSYVSRVINNRRVTKVNISKLKLVNVTYENIYDISVEEDQSYICNSLYINHNTPMGIGNFFHKQWIDAKNGDSYFNPIRLYWQMHPERNEEWYNSMAKSLGPRRTAQEIDGDFLSSGNTVFDLNCIRAIEECLPYPDDYLSIEQNGKLFIRRFAKPGERCFIGADVAIGRANDYSAFSVMNRYGEELAYFRGKINPSKYANLLMHTGKRFNNALIAPESNDIGLAVTSKIQDHGYPNLYYAKKLLKKKGKSKPEVEDIPGWYTTTSTRPIIIDELEEDIRFDQVNICNKFFVDESYTFIFDSRNRPVAMGKDKANDDNIYDDDAVYTDDCIMAEAITNYIRKGKKNLVTNPI